jgi:hypothetical protein
MLAARHAAQRSRCCLELLFLLSLLFAAGAAQAQPSGGPYGPVDTVYKIPKAAHVYFVAPDGKAEASGKTQAQPTTIEAAIEKVTTGDAIVMRGGIYRTGDLVLNQGVTIQPYGGERPVLKGTEVAANWEAQPGGVWRTNWTKLFPAHPLPWWNRAGEEARTPLHRFNNDMVFLDGEFLQSAGGPGELTPHSYYIDYQSHQVYIGADPSGHTVEITAHDGGLIRTSGAAHGKSSDHKGPVIRGLTFTQYARRAIEIEGKKSFGPDDEPTNEPVGPSDPSTYGKDVVGTTLENVTISWCSRVAGYFRGDRLVIRNSLISDTGTEGIYIIGSSDVLLERNIVRRNNIEHLTGYFASAVKIFNQTHRVTVRDNLVLDHPDSNGVWYDVGNRDGVIVNNTVENTQVGFMAEISRGMTVAGNVFVRNGRGVFALNSADVHIFNNTFVDAPAGFSRNERGKGGDLFSWHVTTGPGVEAREGHVFVNNLLVASESYNRPLLLMEQAPALCGELKRSQMLRMDGNVYVRAAVPGTSDPLVVLSPAGAAGCTASAGSLAEFRKIAPQFERRGRQIDRTARSVFRAPDAGQYQLRMPIPAAKGVKIPAEVLKLIGRAGTAAKTAGAYPSGK